MFKFPSADDARPTSVTTPVIHCLGIHQIHNHGTAMRRRITPRVTFPYLTRLSWPLERRVPYIMSATDDLKHAAGDVNHAAGKVAHDAEAAGYELKEKAESAAEDAKDKAVEVKEDVKENAQWAAEKTEENAKAAVESAQQKAKAAADKIADAAARADPRDLKPRNILDGLKNVDRTILRLNKCVSFPSDLRDCATATDRVI